MTFNREISLDDVYDRLSDKVDEIDPEHRYHVYDLDAQPTGGRRYSVVDSKWLYETFCKAYPDTPYLFMPHQHLTN